jgi:hypothetical protein
VSGRKPTLSEAKRLLSRWDPGTFETIAASIRFHAPKHATGMHLWTYLRRAAAFRKKRATRRYSPDGTVRYEKPSGEFMIEREGKIVTYGTNE